jgi:hypothetical protein
LQVTEGSPLQPQQQGTYHSLVSKIGENMNAARANSSAMNAFAALVTSGLLLVAGCGQQKTTGVVQSCKLVKNGYELALGPSDSSDYALVQIRALLDAQGMVAIQRDGNAVATLGNRFVGKRVCFYGDTQRDERGRKFVLVKERKQIQVLR